MKVKELSIFDEFIKVRGDTTVSEGRDIPGLIVVEGEKLRGLLSVGDMLEAITPRKQYKFSLV